MDVEFGLQRGSQKGSLGESRYVSQLKRGLRFAHNKAKQMAKRQQAKHRELYDQRCWGAELEVGGSSPGTTDCLERQAQDPR